MKTLKIKLRDDLAKILNHTYKPNQFITEALDLFIIKTKNKTRIDAELTLYLFHAGKHQQTSIDKQKIQVQQAERETVKIEKAMQQTKDYIQTFTDVAKGKIQIDKHELGGWRAIGLRPDNTLIVITQDHTSSKNAKTAAIRQAKERIPRHAQNYGKLQVKQKIAEKRLQAERAKLYDMQKNLKQLTKAFLKH